MFVTVAPDVLFRTLGDELVLLDLKNEVYLGLDAVGARMWALLTESESIQCAYDALLQEYDVEPGQLRKDLQGFLDELLENKLIELSSGSRAAQHTLE